jgi:uracil-DNA glycosylase
MFEGSKDAKVLFISDFLRVNEQAEQRVLSGQRREILANACRRAGLAEGDCAYTVIHPVCPPGGTRVEKLGAAIRALQLECANGLIAECKANVLVPLGDYALRAVTGHMSSIMKHHCTIMPAKAALGLRKTIPLIHPEIVAKDFALSAYTSFGLWRIKDECFTSEIVMPKRHFIFDQQEAFAKLEQLKECELAVDLEFDEAGVTVVGIAWSPFHALALDMRGLPKSSLRWTKVRELLENAQSKIFHHFACDCQQLQQYDVRVGKIGFDTMLAMKLLHPELDKGLDNAARIYTRFPYWKDDAIDGNWLKKLEYNCCDTTATFATYEAQRDDLAKRGLLNTYNRLLMGASEPIRQMCEIGLAIDRNVYARISESVEADIKEQETIIERECLERIGERINTRSPAQLKRALKEFGFNVPKQQGKETVGKKALQKMRTKHPKEAILQALIALSGKHKLRSKLLSIGANERCRYIVDACINEFGEWSGYPGVGGSGAYPADLPRKLRSLFIADDGRLLVEISFPKAELRYLAYDAPEPKLIVQIEKGLEPGKLFAGALWRRDDGIVSKYLGWIGEKTLMRVAYGVGPRQLIEVFANEHDRVISMGQSKAIIAKAWELYPGLKRRQHAIEAEIRRCKKLSTPYLRERVFYDRIGDALFRQAYQYAPRSMVADITTEYCMGLYGHCELLLHGNDFLLAQIPEQAVSAFIERARVFEAKEIKLCAGRFTPMPEIAIGKQWGHLERY